jgi:hypothetical protein
MEALFRIPGRWFYRRRASGGKRRPVRAPRNPGISASSSIPFDALAKSGAAAALAFYDLVALLQQPVALAILAFLLFLDVGTFLACHDVLHPDAPLTGGMAQRNPDHSTNTAATG